MTKISVDCLKKNDACQDGITIFRARYGDGDVDALAHLRYHLQTNPTWGIWVAVRLPEFTRPIMCRWMLYILSDPERGVERLTAPGSEARKAVEVTSALYRREIAGDTPSREAWAAAEWAGWAATAEWAARAVAAAEAWATWTAASAAEAAPAVLAALAARAASLAARAQWAAASEGDYDAHLSRSLEKLIELLEEQEEEGNEQANRIS